MRQLIILILLLPFTALSQTLHLEISTPQPRVGEDFTIMVNIDTVAKDVFSGLAGKFTVSSYSFGNASSMIGANLNASKTGKNVIGPLTLNINGKKYLTDKLTFDVVDSLPAVNKGLWIRQLPLNDTTTYIIIEQRIPALNYLTHDSTSISMTAKTSIDDKKAEMVQDSVVSFHGSTENQKLSPDIKPGESLNFYQNDFAMYEVKHAKNKPLILTKDYFTNLPSYYKFEDIVIK